MDLFLSVIKILICMFFVLLVIALQGETIIGTSYWKDTKEGQIYNSGVITSFILGLIFMLIICYPYLHI